MYYYYLGILSMLLIVSILLLVLYKHLKDNNNINNETFTNDQETIIMLDTITTSDKTISDGNSVINNLVKRMLNIPLVFNVDPQQINTELNVKIAENIKSQTSDIVKNYHNNNVLSKIQINTLTKNVTDLENIINNKKKQNINNTKYSRIKSLNNGMELDLFSTPNTVFTDNDTGRNINTSLVGFNNGCLSVGSNDYNVYKCNDKNPKQFFEMKHIINETDYKTNIDKSIDFSKVDKSSISYPFAMIKSTNTDNCLTNNHGNITIQPCYSFIAQRWLPL